MHPGECQCEVIVERDSVGDEGEKDPKVDEGGGYDPSHCAEGLLANVSVGFGAGVLFQAFSYDVGGVRTRDPQTH